MIKPKIRPIILAPIEAGACEMSANELANYLIANDAIVETIDLADSPVPLSPKHRKSNNDEGLALNTYDYDLCADSCLINECRARMFDKTVERIALLLRDMAANQYYEKSLKLELGKAALDKLNLWNN